MSYSALPPIEKLRLDELGKRVEKANAAMVVAAIRYRDCVEEIIKAEYALEKERKRLDQG